MKNAILFITLILLTIACGDDMKEKEMQEEMQGEMEEEILDPDYHTLEDILEYLPFDQFNDFTMAIYRTSAGKEIRFFLDIEEEIVEKQFEDKSYSTNEITFSYISESVIEAPNIVVLATLDYIPDVGYKEVIKCFAGTFSALTETEGEPKLTIIPNQDYNHTILNKEFTLLNEEFTNVYSNILIQENDIDKSKLFYQSSMGIIGFLDFTNKSWVLDRFE